MINSKKELKFFIQADMMMNRGVPKSNARLFFKDIIAPDYIIKYLRRLRKNEYAINCVGEYNKLFQIKALQA